MTGAVDDALVIVGGGQMGAALAAGIARRASAGGATGRLVIVEASAERRAALPVLLPSVSVVAELPACRDAIIAVKPADVVAVAAALGAHGARRVVSVAAGVTTAAIAAAAGPAVEVVRAMPNTPALVGEGATAIAPAAGCAAATLAWARGLMESVGRVVEVDERLMDAVTGVSGSGPAYVYMLAEALIDAAVVPFGDVTRWRNVAGLLSSRAHNAAAPTSSWRTSASASRGARPSATAASMSASASM